MFEKKALTQRRLINTGARENFSVGNFMIYCQIRDKIRLRWTEHEARRADIINAYKIMVGNPKDKTPLGRPRPKFEDNFKIRLRQIGQEDDWIKLVQGKNQRQAENNEARRLTIVRFV
jgi:hypothetical protein